MVVWDTLTWEDLAPLYADTWQGEAAAWELLADLLRPLGRVCQHALAGERQADHADAAELVQNVLVKMVTSLQTHQGMPRPSNWEAKSPRGVFSNWAKSRARDCLRTGRTLREDTVSVRADGPSADETLEHLVATTDPRARAAEVHHRLEARERFEMVAAALDDPTLNPRHRLAWLCLRAPVLLAPRHADAAVEASGDSGGVVRDAVDTWALLSQWRDHVVEPDGQASRKELAWVLFSRAEGPPDDWCKDHPKEARTARDLLRKWDRRFENALARLVEEL